ncbi:hypothetical protein HK098_005911 [Nowakowskiella sp. JEL0407]|nr:hypothetical protein HK098_005911 [Nowakowskiella sp. JEL0407]
MQNNGNKQAGKKQQNNNNAAKKQNNAGKQAAAGGGNLGSCSAAAAQLKVALGADSSDAQRAKEVRFVPGGFKVDPIFGGQGSALNGGIVANFICDRLASDCKASAATVSSCRTAQKNVEGKKGGANLNAQQKQALGKVADDFNKAIGITTNFAASLKRRQASNLGSCSAGAAQLKVALGADSSDAQRAKEVRFVPGGFKVDPIFGGQGSALNGGIVANFICDRLASDCKASAATVAACRAAQVNVNGKKGGAGLSADQQKALGQVADTFNKAIGITTNFANSFGGTAGNGQQNNNGNNKKQNNGNKKQNNGNNKKQNNQNNNANNQNNGNGAAAGGSCSAQKLEVVVVGKEQRFGLNGQQVALNPIIPIERICNSFANNGNSACKAKCDAAKAGAAATGVKGNSQGQGDLAAMQKLANDFNAALA